MITEGLTPEKEEQRLAALERYDVLDTPPDGAFDRVTALVARQLQVPISIVSLVDEDRIWFKSHHGTEADEVGRDPGLCASAILQDEAWIVNDAAIDPRTLSNPLVAESFGLRFYVGIPLKTYDGHKLGTLCAIDRAPRKVTDEEIGLLRDLAYIVMNELELRLASRHAMAIEEEARRRAEDRTSSAERLTNQLQVGLESSREIGKALGLLMAQYKIDDQEAFEKLRHASQDLNTKLSTIAHELVEYHNARGDHAPGNVSPQQRP